MDIIVWDDNYETGIELIDNQHKKLVNQINKLDQSITVNNNDTSFIEVLDELIDYTRYHFQAEEEYVLSHGYHHKAFQSHQRGHRQFIAKITAARNDCAAHPKETAKQLLDFLLQWLIGHILSSDKKMFATLQDLDEQQPEHTDKSEAMPNALFDASRESESSFRELADSLPAAIWFSDKQGKRIFVNTQFALFVGFPPAACLNGEWLQVVHPDDASALQTAHQNLRASQEPIKIEYRIIRQYAESRWIQETIVPRLAQNGEFAGFIGCGIDISKQKLLEKNLEKAVEERSQRIQQTNEVLVQEKREQMSLNKLLKEAQGHSVQSEKMASLGQLAAGIVHEINNPLGYIYSNLQAMKSYVSDLRQVTDMAIKLAGQLPADDPVAQEFASLNKEVDLAFLQKDLPDLVEESIEGATRTIKIIHDLRDFSHKDKQERGLFDIEAGINATLNIVNNELKYKANVVKNYGGIKPIECVGAQLNQVFMNILVNASQAITGFGTITISTGYEEDDCVWVEIEDSGEGMTDEVIDKMFDAFFTTKPVGKGTGLGLSMSHKIIQDHQGEMKVDSVVGQGTKIRVVLPKEPNFKK